MTSVLDRRIATPSGIRTGSPRSYRTRTLVVALLIGCVALLLRLIAITRSYDLFIDEITYSTIARNLASGKGLTLYGQPFTLHPPAMFGLDALVIKVFGIHGSVDHIVMSLRPVSAVFGALSCSGVFLLVDRIAGRRAALVAGAVLALDPFAISYDSMVMLEAMAGAASLAAVYFLASASQCQSGRRRRTYLWASGLMTAIVVTTKDTFGLVVVAALLVLWVTGWVLGRREMATVLAIGAAGYLVYLGALASVGDVGAWWHANIDGVLRLVGAHQETGFNAPTVHVSLVSRAFSNLRESATSYLILALGPVAALVLLGRVRPWRADWSRRATSRERAGVVIAAWTAAASAYLVYATLFGSIEEQMYYILLTPALCALVVAVATSKRGDDRGEPVPDEASDDPAWSSGGSLQPIDMSVPLISPADEKVRHSGAAPEFAVMAALATVSILNYAYTVVLVYLLPARQYAVVGAGSSLLLVCGTVGAASVPWVLAREIAKARKEPHHRQAAVSFCLMGTLVEAVAAGLITGTIAATYGSSLVVAAIIGSVIAIFTSATACGYLQGFERFGMIALLKVAEVVIKVVAGVLLVKAGYGAAGAIAGFAVGSGVVAVVGGVLMRHDLRLVRTSLTDRRLWSAAGGLMAIQGGVALLASLDVIAGSIVVLDRSHLATYEVAQILTRVPVFVATAMSIIVFPRLVLKTTAAQTVAIRQNLGLWLRITVPVAMVSATLPSGILSRVVPAGYGRISTVLVWTTIAGLLLGGVNLISTYFQAVESYRQPCAILFGANATLGLGAVVALHLDGITGLAISVAVVAAATDVAFALLARRMWPGAIRGLGRSVVGPMVVGVPLVLLRGHPVAWGLWVVVSAVPVMVTLARFGKSTNNGRRSRVLHLGFEDPHRPGAGGGSVRTHEVNSRLVDRFDITVVCARYRGCRTRVDDGVRYVHIGLPIGNFPSHLAYFAALPWALLRFDSDLVVEDFAAPFSSVAVPWLTGRPVIGVVQWLFAREKAEQYRLPFHLVERLGVRSHAHLVAVSDDLGAELKARNATATVHVVPNGLPDEAFTRRDLPRRGVTYLGRLEIAQKGLDLLLQAWADVPDREGGELTLVGDGPDELALRDMVKNLGLEKRVRFAGRVRAEERFDVLASASMVVMPSRYETFGMVAAEALAMATPVVSFAIPCLNTLVDATTGIAVAPFDCAAFSYAITELLDDQPLARELGNAGPGRVVSLRWREVANHQGDLYKRLIESP